MAARVAPSDHEQLHHIVCTSSWDPAPLEAVLLERVQQKLDGPDAALIVDDTTLLEQGSGEATLTLKTRIGDRRRG